MLKFRLIVTLFLATHLCKAQELELEKVKAAVTDSSNQYFYPRLLEEFNSQPEYYSGEKGIYLYYGHIYSGHYKMFRFGKDVNQFEKFLANGRYKKAIEIGEKLFEENPVNLDLLLKLKHCYKSSNMPDKEEQLRKMAEVLVRAIKSMGDQPFRVTSVNDEYIVMKMDGLTGIKRVNLTEDAEKIPRTKVQGINAAMDSFNAKDPRSNEKKVLYFEVLYNLQAMPKD